MKTCVLLLKKNFIRIAWIHDVSTKLEYDIHLNLIWDLRDLVHVN